MFGVKSARGVASRRLKARRLGAFNSYKKLINARFRSSTNTGFVAPRVFQDDTSEDKHAVQAILQQIKRTTGYRHQKATFRSASALIGRRHKCSMGLGRRQP